jgi:hypothetical protein
LVLWDYSSSCFYTFYLGRLPKEYADSHLSIIMHEQRALNSFRTWEFKVFQQGTWLWGISRTFNLQTSQREGVIWSVSQLFGHKNFFIHGNLTIIIFQEIH